MYYSLKKGSTYHIVLIQTAEILFLFILKKINSFPRPCEIQGLKKLLLHKHDVGLEFLHQSSIKLS